MFQLCLRKLEAEKYATSIPEPVSREAMGLPFRSRATDSAFAANLNHWGIIHNSGRVLQQRRRGNCPISVGRYTHATKRRNRRTQRFSLLVPIVAANCLVLFHGTFRADRNAIRLELQQPLPRGALCKGVISGSG